MLVLVAYVLSFLDYSYLPSVLFFLRKLPLQVKSSSSNYNMVIGISHAASIKPITAAYFLKPEAKRRRHSLGLKALFSWICELSHILRNEKGEERT